MPEVIFARPDHHAGSYSDLWRLVELAGYPIIPMHEMDLQSDNCYIFSTHDTHWWGGWPNARARIIYYDIEFYTDADYRFSPGVEVWSADAAYARQKGIRFVPMGGDERLAGFEGVQEFATLSIDGDAQREPARAQWVHSPIDRHTDKRYDVALLAHMTYRRQFIRGQLHDWGVSVAPNEGTWGADRHVALQQSRAMLYVHQRDEYHAVAPQRMCIAAAYKLPVITETLPDAWPFTPDTILMRPYPELAEFAYERTRPSEYRILAEWGEALHHLLCHRMKFRDVIEANV
jgi:hypothetical protein